MSLDGIDSQRLDRHKILLYARNSGQRSLIKLVKVSYSTLLMTWQRVVTDDVAAYANQLTETESLEKGQVSENFSI